jgi:hypothetical protein
MKLMTKTHGTQSIKVTYILKLAHSPYPSKFNIKHIMEFIKPLH